jgi:hypothetical protein
MKRASIGLLSLLVVAACNQGPSDASGSPATPSSATAPTVASPKPTPSSVAILHLGDRISAPEVALADVAKDPASFAGRPFTTHGTVTSVCQEMGCWMEIKDASTGAHLKMHGHAFFIPKTASGKQARVQATLVGPPGSPGAAKGCSDEAECAPKNLALLQLDATGVELD